MSNVKMLSISTILILTFTVTAIILVGVIWFMYRRSSKRSETRDAEEDYEPSSSRKKRVKFDRHRNNSRLFSDTEEDDVDHVPYDSRDGDHTNLTRRQLKSPVMPGESVRRNNDESLVESPPTYPTAPIYERLRPFRRDPPYNPSYMPPVFPMHTSPPIQHPQIPIPMSTTPFPSNQPIAAPNNYPSVMQPILENTRSTINEPYPVPRVPETVVSNEPRPEPRIQETVVSYEPYPPIPHASPNPTRAPEILKPATSAPEKPIPNIPYEFLDDGSLSVRPLETERVREDPVPIVVPLSDENNDGNRNRASRASPRIRQQRVSSATDTGNRIVTRSSKKLNSNSNRPDTPIPRENKRVDNDGDRRDHDKSLYPKMSTIIEERSLTEPVHDYHQQPPEPEYHAPMKSEPVPVTVKLEHNKVATFRITVNLFFRLNPIVRRTCKTNHNLSIVYVSRDQLNLVTKRRVAKRSPWSSE